MLLGVYSNLPWIIAPYYAFATMAGAVITRTRCPRFRAQLVALFELSALGGEFWRRLITLLKPLLWPYTVGSIFGALALAAIAYPLALAFVTSRRRIREIIHHKKELEGLEGGRRRAER